MIDQSYLDPNVRKHEPQPNQDDDDVVEEAAMKFARLFYQQYQYKKAQERKNAKEAKGEETK